MEVGIDRKKDEERESAMRTSQLGGLVGYVRISSIICGLMYPRIYSVENLVHHRRDRTTTLRVLLPFLQTEWDVNNRV